MNLGFFICHFHWSDLSFFCFIYLLVACAVLQVKRLQFGTGQAAVISDNHAYPSDMAVPLNELEVLGRVVWKGGRV